MSEPQVSVYQSNVDLREPVPSRIQAEAGPASSRRPAVIIEQPAEPLPSGEAPCALDGRTTFNEFVAQPLMIPLSMSGINDLRERPTDMPIATWTAPFPALRLDRAHDAVGGGICIRRLTWRLYDANSSLTERRPHGLAPRRIPIADQ